MAFRSSENVQRNELVRFQLESNIRAPAAGAEQQKNGYKFTVNDRGTFYDWYNAFFELRFKIDLKADGGDNADAASTVINGSHSFIKHLVIKSGGKIIYDTDNLHLVTFVKNLLEYSDDYSRTVAKNTLWCLESNDSTEIRPAQTTYNSGFHARQVLTANNSLFNVTIPLNRYSFFEELEGRMLPPMQLDFEINLQLDAELLYGAVDTTRVVIDRFFLWVTRLELKDSLMSKYVSDFQKPSKWKYLREMYQHSSPNRNSGDLRISASIDNVRQVFVYLQRLKNNNIQANPYIFDTFKLNAADANSSLLTCRLEYGNGVFYPELNYDTESKPRIFSDVMNYSWKKNDYNTGTQLNVSNYSSLYPLIYFDLSYPTEQVSRDPKQLVNLASAAGFQIHAIVLYENDIVVDKVGDQLVIV